MLVEEHTQKKIIAHTVRFPALFISALHWHENCEICMPLSSATFLIGGETINAVPGDVLVIDEFVPHQITMPDKKTDIIIVHMQLSCFIDQGIRLERIKPYITKEELDGIPLLSEKINSILGILCGEGAIIEDPKENPFLCSMAASLYYLLMRHFSVSDHTAPKNAERAEFYSITEYINQNFKEDITVSSISSALFITKRKLSEIFRKFAGMSINSYITTLRLKNANYLLMHGRGISEAAYESGFQSLRTFNNAYKMQMGISPTEYIKRGGIIPSGDLM